MDVNNTGEWCDRGDAQGIRRVVTTDYAAYSSDGFPEDGPIALAESEQALIALLEQKYESDEAEVRRIVANGDVFVRRRVIATAFHDDENTAPDVGWIDDSGTERDRAASRLTAEYERLLVCARRCEADNCLGGAAEYRERARMLLPLIDAIRKGISKDGAR